ncbi:MAG TPA: response regulator, partial [Permianibacter sp.]|nr:response regulator [Permianibacter sp.]
MIRVLIVDDEAPARAKLQRWLGEQSAFTVVGEADNGLSAAEAIAQQQPDLVLLDIQMPGLSGLEVAAQIDVTPAPLIVFVTAFDDHAVKAFELNAVDYLLKPYDKDRLLRTLTRVQQRLQTRSTPANAASTDAANSNKTDSNTAESSTTGYNKTDPNNGIDSARHAARALQQQHGPLNRLLVPVGEGLQLLDVDRIHWCQADDNYLHLHTDTARYTLRRTLQDL